MKITKVMYDNWAVITITSVYILTFTLINHFGLYTLESIVYQVPQNTPEITDYLKLLVSIFSHHTTEHLIMNTIGVLFFGTLSKDHITNKGVFIVYIIAGLSGTFINSLVLDPQTHILGGSSGAFALLVIGMVNMYQNAEQIPDGFGQWFAQTAFLVLLIGVILDQLYKMFTGAGIENVGYVSHVIGILIGINVIGYKELLSSTKDNT